MAILEPEEMARRAREREKFRNTNVSCKLSQSEERELSAHAKRLGKGRGEFIRDLILLELRQVSNGIRPSPELVEVMGIRLLLDNILRPMAAQEKMPNDLYDSMVLEVDKHKAEQARNQIRDLER